MTLQIFDSTGTELVIGDLVKIQVARNVGLTFYTRVQIINGQIYPLNKFTFDRIVKVDSIPDGCTYSPADIKKNFPEYWVHPNVKLHLIDNYKLEDWWVSYLAFEYNHFMKVSE